MTRRGRAAVRGEPLNRVYYDIAQILESASDSEARVIRVLERLRSIVPYARCAVLQILPGGKSRRLTAPETAPAERAELATTLTMLLGRLSGEENETPEASSDRGMHLAVPVVALDEVVGVLFVHGADGGYDERHVSRLSVVAAKLGAYFAMLLALAREAEQALKLEESRQAAETANRTKDEFLALVSRELRTPLNAILAWADTLRSPDTCQADRTRAFEEIERSVRAQAKLIDDLLDFSGVSQDVVELHGGHIHADSPGEKQGATFTVELPLAQAAPEALARLPAPRGTDRENRALAGVRVLVVDDDKDICEVLQVVLEGQGAVVTVATSAAEALAALERSIPSVLLSDIAMPGETGHDLMRKIVAREGDGAPPAAALSSYALEQDLQEALASGFRMLLAKPVDPEALIAAVATLAGTSVDDCARHCAESRLS